MNNVLERVECVSSTPLSTYVLLSIYDRNALLFCNKDSGVLRVQILCNWLSWTWLLIWLYLTVVVDLSFFACLVSCEISLWFLTCYKKEDGKLAGRVPHSLSNYFVNSLFIIGSTFDIIIVYCILILIYPVQLLNGLFLEMIFGTWMSRHIYAGLCGVGTYKITTM